MLDTIIDIVVVTFITITISKALKIKWIFSEFLNIVIQQKLTKAN